MHELNAPWRLKSVAISHTGSSAVRFTRLIPIPEDQITRHPTSNYQIITCLWSCVGAVVTTGTSVPTYLANQMMSARPATSCKKKKITVRCNPNRVDCTVGILITTQTANGHVAKTLLYDAPTPNTPLRGGWRGFWGGVARAKRAVRKIPSGLLENANGVETPCFAMHPLGDTFWKLPIN